MRCGKVAFLEGVRSRIRKRYVCLDTEVSCIYNHACIVLTTITVLSWELRNNFHKGDQTCAKWQDYQVANQEHMC